MDKNKKDAKFEDDDLELDEIEELEEKVDSKKHDDDDDDNKSDRKKDSDDKKDSKKSKDKELLEDEEEDSIGAKVVAAVVIIAIIGILIFKAFSSGKVEYTITFEANGGSAISSAVVEKNSTVAKPADPTKDGYVFVGWYYMDRLYDFNSKVTADIKLEARWLTFEEASVSEVTLDQDTISMLPGDLVTLVATVNPGTALNKSLTWTSSDTNVATVDQNGKVTAIAVGTATITVRTNDGSYTATATVKVASADNVVRVTGVSLDRTALELSVNNTTTLVAKVNPGDATNKKVTWSSSDTTVATVDQNGKVTGKKDGNVTITVTTADGGFTATATIAVKTVKVTGVSLNKTTLSLTTGGTSTLTATIKPANASNKKVTWSSDNTSVATVDKNGKVTAVSAGTAKITVTTADGSFKATCTVTVTAKTVTYRYSTALIPKEGGYQIGDIRYYSVKVCGDGKRITNLTRMSSPVYVLAKDGSGNFKVDETDYGTITGKSIKVVLADGTTEVTASAGTCN